MSQFVPFITQNLRVDFQIFFYRLLTKIFRSDITKISNDNRVAEMIFLRPFLFSDDFFRIILRVLMQLAA